MKAKYGLLDEALPLLEPRPVFTTERANMLLEDMLVKPEGITSIDYPGIRVADGIFKLRKAGVDIQTIHGGEFAGHHGRYRLRSSVVRLPDSKGAPGHNHVTARPSAQAGDA
jgi:hypothetical protein